MKVYTYYVSLQKQKQLDACANFFNLHFESSAVTALKLLTFLCGQI